MMLMNYFPTMLQDEFDVRVDRLFDDALHTVGGLMQGRSLAWNVYEKDNWLRIDAAVPGLTAKDVNLTVNHGVLTLSIIRPEPPVGDKGLTYFVQEIGWENVSRSMKLPAHVDTDNATATCKDGVLSIGFPKRVEALSRQILIEGAQPA